MTGMVPPPPVAAARDWIAHIVLPAAGFLLAAALIHVAGLDWIVSDLFFDPASASFPARHAWWAEVLLHKGGRNLVLALAILAGGCWLRASRDPRAAGLRADAGYLLVCIALTTGIAGGLKRATAVDCPWDLQRYGGSQPFVGLLEPRSASLPQAACFPGAHSSGAFSLFGLYFLLRRRRSRHARAALCAVSILGLGYAVTQWLRGAHFPSHDLASAALGWFVGLAVDSARQVQFGSIRLPVIRRLVPPALLLAAGAMLLQSQPARAATQRVQEIAFEGNQVTRPETMLREMVVHEGDPVDEEQVERSRQAVLDLGLFRSVQVRQESLQEGVRLVFVVEEKWYLVGYPRLSANGDGQNSLGVELRWNNVWGLNHSLRLLARSRDAKDADRGRELALRASYQAPFIFGSDYGANLSFSHSATPILLPTTYEEQVDEAQVLITHPLFESGPASQGWMLGGGLLWRNQDTVGESAPTPYGNSYALVGQLDYRDVHYKVFSEEGTIFNTRYEMADRNLGSDYSYSRLTGDFERSIPLGLVPHQTMEFGLHTGFANNGPDGVNDFSVGGANGLRGFPRKVSEGDFYYLASAHYLRPVGWDWLRLVVGVEAGNAHREFDLVDDYPLFSLNLGLRLRLPRFVNFEFEAGLAVPVGGGGDGVRFYGDRSSF